MPSVNSGSVATGAEHIPNIDRATADADRVQNDEGQIGSRERMNRQGCRAEQVQEKKSQVQMT